MSPKRVIVNGAYGKMGRLACVTLTEHPEFSLVASLGRADNLAEAIQAEQPDLVVDLTRAECVYTNALTVIDAGVHLVIGTSGLLDIQIDELRHRCELNHCGGIIVPNFSISAVLMMRFSAMAAAYLTNVEIIEAHHPQKADAPSGTAIKTAEMIANARACAPDTMLSKELIPGALGANHRNIPIHSIRLPGVLAEQQVIFGHPGETLSLSHRTLDRASFMPGLVLACQRVCSFNTLYYGLETLL